MSVTETNALGFVFRAKDPRRSKHLKNTMHICLASDLNSVSLLSGQRWHEQSALLFLCQAKHLSSSVTFRTTQNGGTLSRGCISEILPHMMNTRYLSKNLQLIRNEHSVRVLSRTYSKCCHTRASLCRESVFIYKITDLVKYGLFFTSLFMVCLMLQLEVKKRTV